LTRTKNAHFYEHKIHPTWTPIESISKDIQIGSKFNSYYNKDVISYSISCKTYYYQAQGLTLDHLAFDPNGVYKQHFPIWRTKNFLPPTFTNGRFPNWPKCCLRNALIANNYMMGCPNAYTTYTSSFTCFYFFFQH